MRFRNLVWNNLIGQNVTTMVQVQWTLHYRYMYSKC